MDKKNVGCSDLISMNDRHAPRYNKIHNTLEPTGYIYKKYILVFIFGLTCFQCFCHASRSKMSPLWFEAPSSESKRKSVAKWNAALVQTTYEKISTFYLGRDSIVREHLRVGILVTTLQIVRQADIQ